MTDLMSWLVWCLIAAFAVWAVSHFTGWYAMDWAAIVAAAVIAFVLHLWKPMPINT